ncbi:MAG: polysaccharide deacetylase family protein [Thermoplasmataceae archaeon]
MNKKEIYFLIGIDFDSVAGWIGSYGGESSYGDLQQGIFAAEVGVKRLISLLKRLDLTATWFCPGLSLETFPSIAQEIASAGFEIGSHGYSHEDPRKLSVQQERFIFKKSISIIRELTGKKPTGYVAPHWEITEQTSQLLNEFKFRYDHSEFHRDFEAYFMRSGERWNSIDYTKEASSWCHPLVLGNTLDIVEIPANWYLDDVTPLMFMKNIQNTFGFIPAVDVFRTWYNEFRWLLNTDEENLNVFPITLHPDVSGRAHIIESLEKFMKKIIVEKNVVNINFNEFQEHFRMRYLK